MNALEENRTALFGEDYYMRGPERGLSNYRDYKWLESLTVPACKKTAEYLGMRRGDSIIDVGCALGFYVKAFRRLGFRAFGQDISEWAIDHCDPEVEEFVSLEIPKRAFDWAHLKDVAEHLHEDELARLIDRLNESITKGAIFIVPLASEKGGEYVRAEDNQDITHVLRWTLNEWITFLEWNAPDFNVNASYHIHGLKPASQKEYHSCGFLTLIRP